jgi:hypothetical protein
MPSRPPSPAGGFFVPVCFSARLFLASMFPHYQQSSMKATTGFRAGSVHHSWRRYSSGNFMKSLKRPGIWGITNYLHELASE